MLYVLLNRLSGAGILPECDIYCALVPPAPQEVGLACFKRANVPEMLIGLRDLGCATDHLPVPTVVNLSLSTHVGPHNGQSPAEAFVHTLTTSAPRRFLCCAAGNDGAAGIAAVQDLSANVPDF